MVDVTLRVVSDPNPGRSTLVDFSTPPLFWVAGFSAPAPRRRTNAVSSFQADGSTDAAVAWSDRELTITFGIDAGTGDMAAGLLQVLGRTFRDPVWLEFRAGTTNPVFFRTRATTIDEVEDFGLVEPGVRQVRLDIPAAPFARGLPVTGTALVPNDPTDGGMRFTISDVKGDVPAPLNLSLNFGTGTYYDRRMVGSSTYPTFHHVTAVPSNPLGASGMTLSTETDAAAIGGSFGRATITASTTPWVDLSFSGIVPGEYRLLVRVRSSQAGSLGPWVPTLGPRASVVGTSWQWLDLGVYRFPTYAPAASPWDAATTTTATWRGKWDRPGSGSATVDLDHAVLVPSPGGDGSDGTVLFSQAADTSDVTLGYDMAKLTVSSASEQAFYATTTGQAAAVASVSGAGFPRVTPGVANTIILARLNAAYGSTPPADSKSSVTTVDWSYHPCYLTIRGD